MKTYVKWLGDDDERCPTYPVRIEGKSRPTQ